MPLVVRCPCRAAVRLLDPLLGDFNAYAAEAPMALLADAGYVNLGKATGKHSYAFGGLVGSLDHVMGSPAAAEAVTGADIWNINSVESVALEYSRFNTNITNFYAPDAYRSSDHDPILIGLDLAPAGTETEELNLLNINDFHGRIDANTVPFAGTVEQLKSAAPEGSSLFLSAGDNIGASLFASSIQQDAPTLDVLNALDLRASALGNNHEFDAGFTDLVDGLFRPPNSRTSEPTCTSGARHARVSVAVIGGRDRGHHAGDPDAGGGRGQVHCGCGPGLLRRDV